MNCRPARTRSFRYRRRLPWRDRGGRSGAATFLRTFVSVFAAVTLAGWSCSAPVPAPTPPVDASAFGDQICGRQTGDDRPGYRNTLPTLAPAGRRLSGAGSTFVAPVMSVWAERYAELAGTEVAYQPIGSSGGVAQVIAGTVDFGVSDTPMTSAERARSAPGGVLQIPVTLGAVAVAYHVSGLGSGLRFDGAALGAWVSNASVGVVGR